ncbi:MAG: DegT/DnrJ/EryC1/StrS family aminotransferase, partial [Christensenellaceae bacterium]
MRTKDEIQKEIFSLVREYTDVEMAEKKPFRPGQRIPYSSRVYDANERLNLVDSALEFWLTAGRYCDEFEREFAKFLDVKHVA